MVTLKSLKKSIESLERRIAQLENLPAIKNEIDQAKKKEINDFKSEAKKLNQTLNRNQNPDQEEN